MTSESPKEEPPEGYRFASESLGERLRWWVIALLPRCVATWLWKAEWIPLGKWAPYVLGQSLGQKGRRIEKVED